MLISCSYALLFHYDILLWLSSSPFKLNLTIIELEQICWMSHGATESSSSVQPHLPRWGGPNSVYCHASRRYLQPGKVMSACYPDQVGGYNLVYPVLVLHAGPRLGRFCLATTAAVCHMVTRGHPWHSPKGSLSEWPGECHAIDWFCQNVIGPPEWEHEAMIFVVWVKCTNLCRVYNLSIATSSVMDTVCSRSHCGSTEINNRHT
jgi:hypothetical protein